MSQIRSQFKNSDESIKEADANFKSGKFAEAEPLYLLALVLLERQFPEEHAEVLSVMEKLGDTFYASEKWKDAAPVYRRLVGIREKVNGPTQQTVSALFKLSKTYERLNQFEDAETNYKRAVKLGEDTQGHLFANLLDAYAAMLKRNGRNPDEAAQLEEKAKKRRETVQAAAREAKEAQANAAAAAAAAPKVEPPPAPEPVKTESLDSPEPVETEAAAAPPERKGFFSYKTSEGGGSTASSESPTFSAAEPAEDTAKEKNYSLSELDSIKPPSESAAAAFSGEDLDAIKAPGDNIGTTLSKAEFDSLKGLSEPAEKPEGKGFSIGELDAIGKGGDKAAPEENKKASGFDLAELDAIKAPDKKESNDNKGLLNSIKTSEPASASLLGTMLKKPEPANNTPPASAPAASAGAAEVESAAPAESGAKKYDLSELESIKTPSVPPPDVAAAQGIMTTGSHSQLSPTFTPPPAPVTMPDELDPDAPESRKALSATRTGLSRVQSDGAAGQGGKRTALVVVVVVFLIGWIGFMAKMLFSQGLSTSPAATVSLYAGKVFETADQHQELTFNEGSSGDLKAFEKHYRVWYKVWSGSINDELSAMTGTYDNYKWLQECKEGVKSAEGALLYSPDSPEAQVINQMWEIARAAEKYYQATGRYPRHGLLDPPKLRAFNPKITYVNPVTNQQSVPLILELSWPLGENPGRPTDKTELEQTFERGANWNPQVQNLPGEIHCAQLGWPKVPFADDFKHYGGSTMDTFLITGCDRDGHLIQGLNGKIFMIVLKKGQNCTEDTSPTIAPSSQQATLELCVSKDPPFNKMMLIGKYVSILVAVFLIIIGFWKRGQIAHWYSNLK